MFHSKTNVGRLYRGVISDVIDAISNEDLDPAVDEQVLAELRRLWLAKLLQSGALEAEQPVSARRHNTNVQITQYGKVGDGSFSITAPAVEPKTEAACSRSSDVPRIIMHANSEGALATGSDIVPCDVAAQLLRSGQGPLNLEDFSHCAGRLTKLTKRTQLKATTKRPAEGDAVRADAAGPDSARAEAARSCPKEPRPPPKPPLWPCGELPGQLDGAGVGAIGSDEDSSSDEDESFMADGTNESHVGSPSSLGSQEPPDPDEVLNSNDDEEDPIGDEDRLEDIDNIVVCQYAKVHRKGAHWKIRLTQGIMNIEGKDLVFSRMDGEADW